jgi:hypothetical protein
LRPTKQQLEQWRKEDKSYSEIKEITGYSKGMISRWYEQEGFEPAKPGRKEGFKTSDETKQLLSKIAKERAERG